MATASSLTMLTLLWVAGAGAFKAAQLTGCPQGDLTLAVPEHLPLGSTLFTWDPAKLSLSSNLQLYRRRLGKSLLDKASPAARAFFTAGSGSAGVSGSLDNWEDSFALAADGEPRATLVRKLPVADGLGVVTGRFHLTCSPVVAATAKVTVRPATRFRVHLRLLHNPLSPKPLWHRPLSRVFRVSDTPAGSSLRISLRSLLVAQARVRLLPSSSGSTQNSSWVRLSRDALHLLLDLRPRQQSLTVSLEATDAAGRQEVANLTLVDGSQEEGQGGFLMFPCGKARGWPLLTVQLAAVCLLVCTTCAVLCFCCLAAIRARVCHIATSAKPTFV